MKDEFKNTDNWSKHFLPHYNAHEKYQMITYRLADSLPQNILHSLSTQQSSAGKTTLGSPQSSAGKTEDIERRKIIESVLDKGDGSCLLSKPDIAKKVIDTWKFYHKQHYELIAYVVMPNHIHVMIKTLNTWDLGKIVWAWKSYVAKYVYNNDEYKQLFMEHYSRVEMPISETRIPEERLKYFKPAEGSGVPRRRFWHREYWDRFIRDENHFQKAVEYIHMNPVKARLAKNPSN